MEIPVRARCEQAWGENVNWAKLGREGRVKSAEEYETGNRQTDEQTPSSRVRVSGRERE